MVQEHQQDHPMPPPQNSPLAVKQVKLLMAWLLGILVFGICTLLIPESVEMPLMLTMALNVLWGFLWLLFVIWWMFK
jgi:hypothetical protein